MCDSSCVSNCITVSNQSPVTLYAAAFYTADGDNWAATGTLVPNNSTVLPIRGYFILISADPIVETTYDDLNAYYPNYKNGVTINDSQGSASAQVTLQNGTTATMTVTNSKVSSDQNYQCTVSLQCADNNCGTDPVYPQNRLNSVSYPYNGVPSSLPSDSAVATNQGNVPLYFASIYTEAGDCWSAIGFAYPGMTILLPIEARWIWVSTAPFAQSSYGTLQPVTGNYAATSVLVGNDANQMSASKTVKLPDGSSTKLQATLVDHSNYQWTLVAGATSKAAAAGGPSGAGAGNKPKSKTTIIIIGVVVAVVVLILLLVLLKKK
jgi:hypothetical protein